MIRYAVAALALGAACNKPAAPPPAPRFGDLMTQVARRFELVGRASLANRWELAAFELDELRETFEDLPRAAVPEDVKADVPTLIKQFVPTIETTLAAALAKKDPAQLATAFATAAGACNGCHIAAGKPFIEVPTKPGELVPRLDPLP